MTMDFFLGQLRLALVAALAYAGGRGWLTPTDSGFAVALITSLGPIIGPWIWSVYVNINGKIVPQHAMVVDPINTAANADKLTATVQTSAGTMTGKMLGILVLLAAGALAWPGQAHAQLKTPQQIISDLKAANARLSQKVTTAVTPAADPATAVPCDFKMLIKLTPDNLLPTVKACLSDVNSQLTDDTQRALDSAKEYVGPNGGATGDGDGINCLTPGLAIFKAGVQVPEVPAVMSADGTTVITPAVPAKDPGPILLYQKYREFTLAGGLTACQTWFNGPINATAAAGIAGAGSIIAGAALLAPK